MEGPVCQGSRGVPRMGRVSSSAQLHVQGEEGPLRREAHTPRGGRAEREWANTHLWGSPPQEAMGHVHH